MSAIETMHRKKMYKKLVMYVDACYSGTMFLNLPEHLNVVAVVVPPAADLAVHVLHLFIMRVHQLALVGFELLIDAAGKKAHALTSQ